MTALLVAALMIAAPAAGKPIGIKRAIKTANRVAASATATWTSFDPGSDEYKNAIETVKQSGAFDRPVKVSVSNVAIQIDPSGAITVKGVFEGLSKNINKFYTPEELRRITDFDNATKAMDAKFKTDLEAQRRNREYDHRRYYDRYTKNQRSLDRLNEKLRLLRLWVMDRQDEHKANMKARATERQRFATDLGANALARKKQLETVHIETTIPPALSATIDMKKLTTKKRVLLTIQVRTFGFRERSDEVDYPVSIGGISGETIAITRSFLKKTP